MRRVLRGILVAVIAVNACTIGVFHLDKVSARTTTTLPVNQDVIKHNSNDQILSSYLNNKLEKSTYKNKIESSNVKVDTSIKYLDTTFLNDFVKKYEYTSPVTGKKYISYSFKSTKYDSEISKLSIPGISNINNLVYTLEDIKWIDDYIAKLPIEVKENLNHLNTIYLYPISTINSNDYDHLGYNYKINSEYFIELYASKRDDVLGDGMNERFVAMNALHSSDSKINYDSKMNAIAELFHQLGHVAYDDSLQYLSNYYDYVYYLNLRNLTNVSFLNTDDEFHNLDEITAEDFKVAYAPKEIYRSSYGQLINVHLMGEDSILSAIYNTPLFHNNGKDLESIKKYYSEVYRYKMTPITQGEAKVTVATNNSSKIPYLVINGYMYKEGFDSDKFNIIDQFSKRIIYPKSNSSMRVIQDSVLKLGYDNLDDRYSFSGYTLEIDLYQSLENDVWFYPKVKVASNYFLGTSFENIKYNGPTLQKNVYVYNASTEQLNRVEYTVSSYNGNLRVKSKVSVEPTLKAIVLPYVDSTLTEQQLRNFSSVNKLNINIDYEYTSYEPAGQILTYKYNDWGYALPGDTIRYTFSKGKSPIEFQIEGDSYSQPYVSSVNKNIYIKKTNPNVTISSITLNGEPYTLIPDLLLTEEGTYEIECIDAQGNISHHTTIIDKTKPTLTVNKVGDRVVIDVNEEVRENSLGYEKEYLNHFVYSDEGYYELRFSDRSNNYVYYNFQINKSPITINNTFKFIQYQDEIIYSDSSMRVNVPRSQIIGDEFAHTLKKDGVKVEYNDNFETDGFYELTISNNILGTRNFRIVVDSKQPTLDIKGSNGYTLYDQSVVNSPVSVNITDENLSMYAVYNVDNDLFYDPSKPVADGGYYIIYARDYSGNEVQSSFIIDKQGPDIYIINANTGVDLTKQSFSNGPTFVQIMDYSKSKYSAKYNGTSITWPSNSVFTKEGSYEITAYDQFNNKSVYKFTIDTTKPTVGIKTTGGTTLATNAVTNQSVFVSYKDTNYSSKTVTKNGTAYTWPTNNTFTVDGKYVVTVKDKAGNSTSVTFSIDKLAPVIKGVETSSKSVISNNGYANESVLVSILDSSTVTKTVKKNGVTVTWPSNSTFTSDAKYVVTAKDKYGRVTTYTFIIDKSKPTLGIKTTSGTTLSNNAYTKSSVVVSYKDTYYASKTVTKNGSTYTWPSTNTFTSDGKYVVTVKDKAGNVSTVTFTIDKVVPKITAKDSSGISISNGGSTTKPVTITVTEVNLKSKNVTKNGIAITWPTNNTFISKAKYVITVTDQTGNKTTFTFTIK